MQMPSIFPAPRKYRFLEGSIDTGGSEWIVIEPGTSRAVRLRAIQLAGRLSAMPGAGVAVTAARPQKGAILADVRTYVKGIAAQGYRLKTLKEGFLLECADMAGALNGLETLSQILEQTGRSVPRADIEDSPDFPHRGFMLDISRCKVPTMKTLYSYVDLLARLKYNQFQLYTEHTYAFSAHRKVWEKFSPMTHREILELDEYCRDRGVELVPNQNSFGHFERWLCYPEYRHLAESPDGFTTPWGRRMPFGTTLKPDSASLRFIDSLYDELLPNFQSRLFNVGCDETWELGKGRSKAIAEKIGTTRLYLDFLLKIHRLVTKYGRRMMFWGDIILHNPELIRELPKDVIALDWGYEADHPFDKQCRHFARSGIPFYVCPGTSSWNSLIGRTDNCVGNLTNAARSGIKHGAGGYLVTDWGDGGHHQYLPVSYPGMFAGAAQSWCSSANDGGDLAAAMDRLVFKDSRSILGQAVLDMGNVYRRVPTRQHNNAVFNDMLFWNLRGQAPAAELKVRSAERCAAGMEEIGRRIAGARPQAADGALVKDELRNALAMARHGIERWLWACHGRGSVRSLKSRMRRIMAEHRRLWLARNRPGGLHESSARLAKSLRNLGR